jgi:hypothetical protein
MHQLLVSSRMTETQIYHPSILNFQVQILYRPHLFPSRMSSSQFILSFKAYNQNSFRCRFQLLLLPVRNKCRLATSLYWSFSSSQYMRENNCLMGIFSLTYSQWLIEERFTQSRASLPRRSQTLSK